MKKVLLKSTKPILKFYVKMTLTVLLVETFVIAFLLKRSSESAPFLIAAITLLTLAVSAGMFNIYLYRKALSAHNREQNIKSLKNFFSRK